MPNDDLQSLRELVKRTYNVSDASADSIAREIVATPLSEQGSAIVRDFRGHMAQNSPFNTQSAPYQPTFEDRDRFYKSPPLTKQTPAQARDYWRHMGHYIDGSNSVDPRTTSRILQDRATINGVAGGVAGNVGTLLRGAYNRTPLPDMMRPTPASAPPNTDPWAGPVAPKITIDVGEVKDAPKKKRK